MAAVANRTPGSPNAERAAQLVDVSIDSIFLGPNIREVRTGDVAELSASIKEQGILEPVLITASPLADKGGRPYTLVAGFRRVAAARAAGLKSVPAIVRMLSKEEVDETRLVENIQRSDLTPVEEARALKAWLVSTKGTQDQLARRIGKSQPYVAKRLRLLELPGEAAELLQTGKITPATAEQILKLPSEATTELKRVVRSVEDDVRQDGQVDVRSLRWTIHSAKRSFEDRQAKRRAQDSAKFPRCPKKGCGKQGHVASRSELDMMRCSSGHRWSAKTGTIEAPRPYYRPESRPLEPKLPLVEEDVSSAVGLATIARRVLDGVGEISSFNFSREGKTRVRISFAADAPKLVAAKIPGFTAQAGWKFVRVQGADKWIQRTDAERKEAARRRSELEGWLGTFGKPGRRKKSTA